MAQYNTGVVTLSQGSHTVTGVGTAWLSAVSVGDLFMRHGLVIFYQILAVNSNTELTLAEAWQGVDEAAAGYAIVRDFSPTFGFPLVQTGDVMAAAVMARAMTLVDQALAELNAEALKTGAAGTLSRLDVTGRAGSVARLSAQSSDYSLLRLGIGGTDIGTLGVGSGGEVVLGCGAGGRFNFNVFGKNAMRVTQAGIALGSSDGPAIYPLEVSGSGQSSAVFAVGDSYNLSGGMSIAAITRNNGANLPLEVRGSQIGLVCGGALVASFSPTYTVIGQWTGDATLNTWRPGADNVQSIGTTSFRLTDIYTTGGLVSSSDANLKTDVQSLSPDECLVIIQGLRPVSFRWRERTGEVLGAEGDIVAEAAAGVRQHWGLIAQDVAQVLAAAGIDVGLYIDPAAAGGDGPKGLRYSELIAPLIAAVQALASRVDTLEATISTLQQSEGT